MKNMIKSQLFSSLLALQCYIRFCNLSFVGANDVDSSTIPLPLHDSIDCSIPRSNSNASDDQELHGDRVCSSSNLNDDYHDTESEFVLPAYFQDEDAECSVWASSGECNRNPTYMLRNCIPSCLNSESKNELISWAEVIQGDEDFASCENYHDNNKATDGADDNDSSIDDDDEDNCDSWADEGYCMSNPSFMLKECAKSCLTCIPSDSTRFEIGVPQSLKNDNLEETIQVMIDTSLYMSKTVMDTTNPDYHTVRAYCQNEDKLCSYWAALGKCSPEDKDYEWMAIHCAPACQTCLLINREIRCSVPENAVNALDENGGDYGLHAIFERIVGERYLTEKQIQEGMHEIGYKPVVLSRPNPPPTFYGGFPIPNSNVEPSLTERGPWVVVLENFLTDEECDRLISKGTESGYTRSTEVNTNPDGTPTENFVSQFRTSTNAWCEEDCSSDPMVKGVIDRISTVTGISSENYEKLQLLHYLPGQFYRAHHDFLESDVLSPQGGRMITFFLYLNDVKEGGGTHFNELGITVQPKKGSALIWPNVLQHDLHRGDERTRHEAMAVVEGVKYGANAWLHLRSFNTEMDGFMCE